MPLLPGKNNVGHNIAEMESNGHPRDQSIAAALRVARKARAEGGDVDRQANLAKFMEGNHPLAPHVLYHGTTKDFSRFNTSPEPNALSAARNVLGAWFTDSPEKANSFASVAPEGSNVMPVHLSVKNPYEMSRADLYRIETAEHAKAVRDALIARGHDGIVSPMPGRGNPNAWVAFHPHQIKSAIGNRGTFDPREPDITKARGGFARADGGRAATHLPFPDSLNIPTPPTKADMDRHARRVDVPLHTARATQTAMDWRKPGERTNPGPMIPGYEDAPVAVRKETGEHLIFDGHHRTVSAINSGRQSMPMHVIDAKHYDPENAGRPPMRHGMSDEEMLAELRPARAAGGGLYANIHAKQERIAHGSGEHMRKPGSEGAPTAKAFKQSARTARAAGGGASWDAALKQQREVEGLKAAIRDPKTGEIHHGLTHKAVMNAAQSHPDGGKWGRLSWEWGEPNSPHVGFVTRDGEFLNRDQANDRLKFGYTAEDARDFLRRKRASGGSVQEKLYTGPIHSPVAGRTDHLPVHVPSGSYVIPADVVSAHGEGNTVAGFKVMRRIFGGTPYKGSGGPYNQSGGPYGQNASGTPYGGSGGPYNEKLARGGSAGSVPVIVAGGEMILDPDQVRAVGEGDLDTGHKVLDEFVKRSRKELIKTLTKLPGPRKD